jgi:hypothetical protein
MSRELFHVVGSQMAIGTSRGQGFQGSPYGEWLEHSEHVGSGHLALCHLANKAAAEFCCVPFNGHDMCAC